MSAFLEVTLYYANWCGHCVDAKKAWTELKENLDAMGNQYKGVKIILNSFEDGQMQKQQSRATINGADIQGYPTIKFGLNCNGKSKEYEYSKQRNAETILDSIKRVAEGLAQCGNKTKRGSRISGGARKRSRRKTK